MKKIIFCIIFLFAVTVAYADDRVGKPYNEGYAKKYGMVGLYGHLSSYITGAWDNELAPGGGGFIYYNLLNNFWGNLSLGVNADYVGGKFKTKDNKIAGRVHMAPLSLNLAYMTSSKVINLWAGIGFSYNFASFDIDSVTHNNREHSINVSQNSHLIGVDAFAGIEYLFTKDGSWGAFFEFRYTYSQKPELQLNIKNAGTLSDILDTQRFKYTIGFTYHY